MPIISLGLVVAILIMIAYYYGTKGKNKTIEDAKKQINQKSIEGKIFTTVITRAKALNPDDPTIIKIPKFFIMESLDISPNTLKSCLQQLINNKIIEDGEFNVRLTQFGMDYYNVFTSK